jgi:hypothetical protein
MVAWLEHRDRGSDLIDNADAFMAQDAPGLAAWQVALENVQICATDRGSGNPDNGIVGAVISGLA